MEFSVVAARVSRAAVLRAVSLRTLVEFREHGLDLVRQFLGRRFEFVYVPFIAEDAVTSSIPTLSAVAIL